MKENEAEGKWRQGDRARERRGTLNAQRLTLNAQVRGLGSTIVGADRTEGVAAKGARVLTVSRSSWHRHTYPVKKIVAVLRADMSSGRYSPRPIRFLWVLILAASGWCSFARATDRVHEMWLIDQLSMPSRSGATDAAAEGEREAEYHPRFRCSD
jgi:hypothetical protein